MVQKLRAEEPPVVDPDDIPRDIDTFRHALAARIEAFCDAHSNPAERGDAAESADEEDEQSWPTSGP
ncbi:MAG TPA: hypothetical protein VG986_12885 [Pseudolabrys sp.]|nr:hypothetical protein [Pseudolabrys sp.]